MFQNGCLKSCLTKWSQRIVTQKTHILAIYFQPSHYIALTTSITSHVAWKSPFNHRHFTGSRFPAFFHGKKKQCLWHVWSLLLRAYTFNQICMEKQIPGNIIFTISPWLHSDIFKQLFVAMKHPMCIGSKVKSIKTKRIYIAIFV